MSKKDAPEPTLSAEPAPATHKALGLETLGRVRELCQHVVRTDSNPTGPGGLAKTILAELGE